MNQSVSQYAHVVVNALIAMNRPEDELRVPYLADDILSNLWVSLRPRVR